MCQHRTHTRWSNAWTAWTATTAASFLALELAALVSRGEDATLTAYSRRALGLDPRCRHAELRRAALLCALVWAAVHLSFGVLPSSGWWDRAR